MAGTTKNKLDLVAALCARRETLKSELAEVEAELDQFLSTPPVTAAPKAAKTNPTRSVDRPRISSPSLAGGSSKAPVTLGRLVRAHITAEPDTDFSVEDLLDELDPKPDESKLRKALANTVQAGHIVRNPDGRYTAAPSS